MATIILQGRNLGERHRALNKLVSEANKKNESLETALDAPESTPVDRLFKIELASKHKHVEYILKNLRDDDMLYVSRALKAKWLLDDAYRDIINPNYLENILYPEMITTAVNKMKHWIHLNLRDSKRCQEFYEYYCEKDKNISLKYLSKCPKEVVEKECSKWLESLTPEYFKILCERSSLVAKIFFEALENNKSLRQKYFKSKVKYFNGLKSIQKSNLSLFLDIVERVKWKFPRLSQMSTRYIMKQGKHRYLLKSELYAVNILHIESLAQCLSPEECVELVLKLARAKYLEKRFTGWFSYKKVEPFIKRLDLKSRADFKKRVFVEKNVGEDVNDWPYPIDDSEEYSDNGDDDAIPDVFEDDEAQPYVYDRSSGFEYGDEFGVECRAYCSAAMLDDDCGIRFKQKTFLDLLFDEYRFKGFDETLYELRKKMAAESVSKNRMSMLLVLVSKTGGVMENLVKLLKFLENHRNEPAHVRAAVVRSLVKRAFIWRASDDVWDSLLTFAEGLGLDGSTSTSDCDEGLHAVVIRKLLENNDYNSAIKTAFLTKFSTLKTYSLSPAEKAILVPNFVKMLLDHTKSTADPYEASRMLINLLDTSKDYNFNIDEDLISNIKMIAAKDKKAAENVLWRLFNSKVGRKELFLENFYLIQTADSYMNALKHNTEALSAEAFVEQVISKKLDAAHFLRKMNIYFGEKKGIRSRFLDAIKQAYTEENMVKLAKTFTHLIGSDLKNFILLLKGCDSMNSKLSATRLNAYAHLARPALCLELTNSQEWRLLGAKYIANRVLVCKQVDVDRIIKQLLTWKQTARLAVTLSKRTDHETDTLAAVADIRPTVALNAGLRHIRQRGNDYDPRVWDIVQNLMNKVSRRSISTSHNLKRYLREINKVPLKIKPDFVTLVYTVLNMIDKDRAVPMICHIKLLLPNINENVVDSVLEDYLNTEFTLDKMSGKNDDNRYSLVTALHLRILGKYLLLCKTTECQTRRFDKVGVLYLERLASCFKSENNKNFFNYINDLLKSLKYTEVFLNMEYVDCLPVMVKIAKWMQTILPMEQYFKLFVDLHLTMSYFRAIRQCVRQKPEIFSDKKRRVDEGAKIVGEAFGKYICHEAHELRLKYFDSIIELYSAQMRDYLSEYFNPSRRQLEPSIIKGLLGAAENMECYLAVDMFNNYCHFGEKQDIEDIREIMKQKNDITSQFLYHCVMIKHR